jgi:transposase
MGKCRRRFSREFKVQVLRELGSGKDMAELCREHNITRFLVARWRREYEASPGLAFSGNGNPSKEASKIAELEKIVGQLYVENDFLKRVLANLKQKDAEERGRSERRNIR